MIEEEYPVPLRRLHARQRPIVEAAAPRTIVRAGRRGGKTVAAAQRAVKRFLAGRRILYAAPTVDQVKTFWWEVTRALAAPIDAGVLYKNETDHVIEKRGTKERIRAKTAWNADTLRGDYADDLMLDEWQLMNESAWEEVGAPMLLDHAGEALFIYTPPSLRSRSVTKATDPLHAPKMFKFAQTHPGRWAAIHFTSHDNPYISAAALDDITQDMTALAYRQEILAEDIDEIPGALWTRQTIEQTRVRRDQVPRLKRIVVGVDPTGSTTNEAGVVAAGIGEDHHLYVLEDGSLLAASPDAWGRAAVSLYEVLLADKIVVERNFGGDMCQATIKAISADAPVQEVVSSRSKVVRAEPVSAKFERGEAHLVGTFPALEDELVSYVAGSAKSPNRLDAMVFAITELAFGPRLGIFDYYEQEATSLARAATTAPVPVRPEAAMAEQLARTRQTFETVLLGR